MQRGLFVLYFMGVVIYVSAQVAVTPYEKSNYLNSATYQEAIDYYQKLSEEHEEIKLMTYGITDFGAPLHLVVISKSGEFNPEKVRSEGKVVLLINNAIHPGEPCGVDASMMLARDLVSDKDFEYLLEHVVVCIIPMYNIGGANNRSCCSRANQVGPVSQGFRGNARNLDLNRDFIKSDSRNAQAFAEIYHQWMPEVFMDNHTTDGADYQHVMTLISTQKDKLAQPVSKYMHDVLEPYLYQTMERRLYAMAPYVHTAKGATPDSGLVAYLETPRYSTGYTALFNTMGFVPEAHMLKTFRERVEATYVLMTTMIEKMNEDYAVIIKNKHLADHWVASQDIFAINWEVDLSISRMIPFRGYTASYRTSEVTGQQRLFYHSSKPWERMIPYYETYVPTTEVQKPVAYVIPQAWHEVIALLKLNKVPMQRVSAEAAPGLEVYYIESSETLTWPYEGHYLHYNTQIHRDTQSITLYPGDIVVTTGSEADKFITHVLEPEAVDSYFNWNFFDAIMMQKEYFSDYVFEETAAEMLAGDANLRTEFEAMKKADTTFAADGRAQLRFLYERSPYYEKTVRRYPVYRVVDNRTLGKISLSGVEPRP